MRLSTERGRKSQEEMVGFVLVIVLIAVISLVFLGFSLRAKQKPQTNTQVDNLLSAMLHYTTDCTLSMPQYETVEDLMKSCYRKDSCINGNDACTELRMVLDKLLAASEGDLTSKDKPIKAYELNMSYSAKQQGIAIRQPEGSLLYIKSGFCSANLSKIGTQQFVPLDMGNIMISLKFCY